MSNSPSSAHSASAPSATSRGAGSHRASSAALGPRPVDGLPQGPLLMGVLNVTPDSFSDGGQFNVPERAAAHALAMANEGAHIIDIGGESTRPGYAETPAPEEIARVTPAIRAARQALRQAGREVAISIDTWKAQTAAAALEAGADIVNDIWGLQRDPDIARVAADHGAPVVIMHNAATIEPDVDIMELFHRFFDASLKIAMAAGISEGRIVLDIGFGFGASRAQHLEAVRRVTELKGYYGLPVLVGASRKSTIGLLTGRAVQDRLAGTLACHTLALACGADIIRAHDVAAHQDIFRVVRGVMDPVAALADAEARAAQEGG